MKKLTLPFLGWLLCFSYMFSSCEVKDNTPCTAQYTYHYLNDWEKKTVPYFINPDYDTISFLAPNNDTITFKLIGIDSSWYKEDANRNPNPDGCSDWQYYETFSGRYQSIKGNSTFRVAVKAKSDLWPISNVEFTLGTHTFSCSLVTFGQKNYIDYVGNYTVNGNEYQDVHFVYNLNKTQIRAYMNSASGLLLIDDKELNQSYSLLK
jgi:hypothetical protein